MRCKMTWVGMPRGRDPSSQQVRIHISSNILSLFNLWNIRSGDKWPYNCRGHSTAYPTPVQGHCRLIIDEAVIHRVGVAGHTACDAGPLWQGHQGQIIIEANDCYIREALSGIFVMRKEAGVDAFCRRTGAGSGNTARTKST